MPAEAADMPVKPNAPAMMEITRKMSAHLSMAFSIAESPGGRPIPAEGMFEGFVPFRTNNPSRAMERRFEVGAVTGVADC